MNTEEIIKEAFKTMNDLKEKRDWEIMLKNAYDTLALQELMSLQDLEELLLASNYKFDKEKQIYILHK